MVLGLTVPLALLSWPGAGSNDASFGVLLLAVFLFAGGSLLIFCQFVLLESTLAAGYRGASGRAACPLYTGKALSHRPSLFRGPNWFLTFGVVVLVLSLILLWSRTRNMGNSVANAACDWCERWHYFRCSLRLRTSRTSWLRGN